MLPLSPWTRNNESNISFAFSGKQSRGFLDKSIFLWTESPMFHFTVCSQINQRQICFFDQNLQPLWLCTWPTSPLEAYLESLRVIFILFVWLSDFNQKLEKLSGECQHLPTHFHPYTSNTHHLETSWGAWHVCLDSLHTTEFQCKRLSCLMKELMSSCSFKYNPQNTCAHLFWYVFFPVHCKQSETQNVKASIQVSER